MIREAIDIAVIERAKLRTAVARANTGHPLRIPAVARQCSGSPARDIGLSLVQSVARNHNKAGILLDQRVSVSDAADDVHPLGQHIGPQVSDFRALRRDMPDILDPADGFIARCGVDDRLRIEGIVRVFRKERRPQQAAGNVFFRTQFPSQ